VKVFLSKAIGRLSVKSKVTLLATALFLLALAVVSSIQLYHVKVEMLRLLGEQQHGFVARMADDVDQKLQTNLNAIAAAAAALSPRLVGSSEGLERWAQDRTVLHSLFSDIFVVSSKGSVLVDVPARGRRGLDVSEQENFRTTVASRKPYISKPFIGKALNQPIVTMSAPVLDRHGYVVAVVTGSINLLQPNFLGTLNDAKIGEGGSFSLVTRERLIITSRNKDRIMTQGPAVGVSPYFDRVVAGGEGSEEAINSRGLHAIFSYSQLEEVPWALVAALPIAEALAPVQHARQKILEVTLLIAFLVAPIIWYGVRRLFDPIQAALREGEAGLRRAQSIALLAHVVTGPDGGFESWSDTLPQLIGVAPERMPKSTREWLEILHPEDRAQFRRTSIGAGKSRKRADIEYRVRRGGRDWINVRQVMEPLEGRHDAGAHARWFNTIQDITAQKQAEIKIRSLNRVHAVLSGINSLIVRVHDRDELFREACRIAVDHGRFKMAWIGVVDRSAMKIVPIASAGAEAEFLTLIKDRFSLREDAPMGNTMSARAVREKTAFVSNEIREDSQVLYAKERVERGISSMAILPLLVSGDAVGVLALYAGEVGFFDDDEMKLLRELARDISFALEHIEKTEKLDYLAYYDALTGIANRSLFLERLEERLLAERGTQRKVAVTVIDIERLAAISDAFGRQAGEQLLQQVTDRLKRVRGDATRLARVGPECFAVLSAGVDNENDVARMTEHKLSACFELPFRIADQELRISARVGIALYPNDAEDAENLLRCAEAALKKARDSGERYLFFTAKMTERIAERLALESKLRQALEKDEFVLHYQPKVDLVSRDILSVEALIRWRSPELGLVPPMEFIPLLEETGLILEVGTWALQRAARDHSGWVQAGLRAPRVAVNVSPIQLRQRDFVGVVEQAIIEGVAPTGIDLEITENLIMGDIQGNIEKLTAIRALGVGIAIDDFGTGYSSLAYLAMLPVETLKIDRAFIVKMTEEPNASMLVQTMISLAHSLRLKVVAEGVETEEQAKLLRLLRCDQMQGYLFSRPLPAEELVALLPSLPHPKAAARASVTCA
jgi:diguanylate cyclase (GGDEF)-like protein